MKNKIILTILILSVISLILSGCDGWDSVIPTIPDDVPVIEESITPNFGPPGTEVTIKGRNFGEVNYLLTNPYLYYNVTFGNSLVIGMSWSDTQIIVEAPSDYGTGIQNASMAAAILSFFVTGTITELLGPLLPELVVLELDVGSEAWWESWYKIAAAIGLPFVGVRPKEGEMDVIVTVETPAGSAEALFTYVVPPQPPTPLSPGSNSAPGPIIYTLTPTLTWAEVDNADYYDLAIKEYPYNTNISYNFQEIYGSSFIVPSERLEEWKMYCWNVRAHNSAGFGNYSEILYFQIENVNELLTITTITASAGPNGSISPSGDQIVNQGSDKSFTITPDTGYQIDDVLVDGSSVGAVSSYIFTNVTEDHTISATFSTVTGSAHRIIFDDTHNPMGGWATISNYFPYLISYLENTKCIVDIGGMSNLEDYDVLVLADPRVSFNVSEITSIQAFLQRGGKLIMLGEHGDFSDNSTINDLSIALGIGITLNQDIVYSDTDNYYDINYQPLISNFVSHAVTTDIFTVVIGCGSSLNFTSSVIVVAWSNPNSYNNKEIAKTIKHSSPTKSMVVKSSKAQGPFIIMAVSEVNGGKVFVVGDTGLWSFDDVDFFSLYNNEKLAENVFSW